MSKLEEASGGHDAVEEDWMPATGLRALTQEDPCLVWLKFWGRQYGFEPDPEEYSFLIGLTQLPPKVWSASANTTEWPHG